MNRSVHYGGCLDVPQKGPRMGHTFPWNNDYLPLFTKCSEQTFFFFCCFLLSLILTFFFAKVCYQTQFEFLILFIYSKFILFGTVSWLNSKPEFMLNNLTIIIIYYSSKSNNSNWNSKFSFKLWLHFQLHSTGIYTVMQRGTKIYQL